MAVARIVKHLRQTRTEPIASGSLLESAVSGGGKKSAPVTDKDSSLGQALTGSYAHLRLLGTFLRTGAPADCLPSTTAKSPYGLGEVILKRYLSDLQLHSFRTVH